MIEFAPLPGISIGPLVLNAHGLMAAVGVVVAYNIFSRLSKNKISEKLREEILLVTIISGIVGARLLYVLENLANYTASPIDIIKIWEGGISYLGGLLSAIAVLYFYLKKKNVDFLKTANLLAIPLVVGHMIGRIGDLLTWDHPGTFTNLSWAVLVNGKLQHPVIAYEMLGLLAILTVLVVASKKEFFAGKSVFIYLGLYGLLRIINDIFRVEPTYLGLRQGQIIGALLFIGAIIGAYASTYKTQSQKSINEVLL